MDIACDVNTLFGWGRVSGSGYRVYGKYRETGNFVRKNWGPLHGFARCMLNDRLQGILDSSAPSLL